MHLPRRLTIEASRPFYWMGLHRRMPPRWGRPILDVTALAMRLPRNTSLQHVVLGGRPAERVQVGNGDRTRVVIYLHGGGYTVGSPRLFRACAANIARAADAVVFNLDYRMAPEHQHPAALEDAVAAFDELVDVHGFAPELIAIGGDSAGGGLTVATARILADRGRSPGALFLLSPWTEPGDTTLTMHRSLGNNTAWGTTSGRRYLGDGDVRDPSFAPMYARLEGLPPTLLQYSTTELLVPQIERFAAKLSAAGNDLTVQRDPRWWHSFHVVAGTVRDATDAVERIGRFLTSELADRPGQVRLA